MKVANNLIKGTIYGYFIIPIIIFFIGWLKWFLAVPLTILLLVSFFLAVRMDSRDYTFILKKNNISTIVGVCFIIMVWVILSGIGNMSYQNGDFNARRSIYRALLEYDWPVVSNDGQRMLIYYIGYWLPSAVVGKIFGYKAGTAFTAVWACLGIFICYYLICLLRGKVSFKYIFVFIFFSGLDYVGIFLLGKEGINLSNTAHIEWWANDIQYSSMTTQLFWVFNQAIPAWAATMLIYLNREKTINHYFILGCILLTSTFPFVGLIPIVLTFTIQNIIREKKISSIFTLQNIVGVVVIGVVSFLYLISNLSAGNVEANPSVEKKIPLIGYILFYFLEFGIYYIAVFRLKYKEPLYYVVIGILLLCPFIKVGSAADFCMRASIPALFIIMIWCMESLDIFYDSGNKKRYIVLILILIIGGKTAYNEIGRSIQCTINFANQGLRYTSEEARIEEDLLRTDNFSGNVDDNFFYKYFLKNKN